MSTRQLLYAVAGFGMVWSLAVAGSGKPFDALVIVILAVLLVHESYRKEATK